MAKGAQKGFHTLTPHLICGGAAEALEFYKKAFGAEELARMPGPEGKIMHAEMRIGDSVFMIADEFPEWGSRGPNALGGSPVTMHLYVEDCDAAFKQAISAGATERMPPTDQFWGDRYGQVADPFGHVWSVATNQKEMTHDEVMAAGAEFMKNMKSGAAGHE